MSSHHVCSLEPYISLLTPAANESGILFGTPTNAQEGGIIYGNSAVGNGMQFRTNGNVTRMTLTSIGDLIINDDTSSIQFPATVSPNDAMIHMFASGTGSSRSSVSSARSGVSSASGGGVSGARSGVGGDSSGVRSGVGGGGSGVRSGSSGVVSSLFRAGRESESSASGGSGENDLAHEWYSLNSEWTGHGTRPCGKPTSSVAFSASNNGLRAAMQVLVA